MRKNVWSDKVATNKNYWFQYLSDEILFNDCKQRNINLIFSLLFVLTSMMFSISFILYILVIFRACHGFQSENEPLKSRIIGHWKEDQQTRTNLNDFLYHVGVKWIRRQLATTLSWENDQTFKSDGTGLKLEMTNGPLKTQIIMKINLDDKFKSSP